jgi:hypothetical protein
MKAESFLKTTVMYVVIFHPIFCENQRVKFGENYHGRQNKTFVSTLVENINRNKENRK